MAMTLVETDQTNREHRPLHLLPRFVERIWGTYDLRPYYAPNKRLIGEVWLTAEECKIEGTSITLGEISAQQPEVAGGLATNGFPLLVKLLFPREKLSVQVHPNDAQAQSRLGQPRGKTECWYVLSAEPDAQVAVGLREALSTEELRAAIKDGSLESHLRMLPIRAGDMIFVDAGTVHAVGPGMVLLEIQQYSDVTYRLWDYGRPRELHVEDGLAVSQQRTAAGHVQPEPTDGFQRLLSCPYFVVDRFCVGRESTGKLGVPGSFQLLVALGEGAEVYDATHRAWPLPPAHAVLLPADAGEYSLRAIHEAGVIRIMPAASRQEQG